MKKSILLKTSFFLNIIILPVITLYAQRPQWFDKVTVLTGVDGSVAPTSGATWGHYIVNPSYIRGAVDHWHSKGGFYHVYMAFGNDYNENPKHTGESLACKDLEGNPIKDIARGQGLFKPNLHNPAYQDSLIKWVKEVIDLGADGVAIDGANPNVWIILNEPAGSFDDFTMKDFRQYLEDRYEPAELQSLFDITDISTFNFAEWIKTHNLQSTWNKWPLSRLPYEFLLFEWKYAQRFLSHFTQTAKSYSLQQYGTNFLVTVNNGSCLYFFNDQIDFLIGEFFYFDRPFLTYAASHIKFRKTLNNKPVVIIPEVSNGIAKYQLVQNSKNMIKHVLSDIYASGGISVVYDKFWCPPYQFDYRYDTEVLKKYTAFILNHPDFYENQETDPQVGLIYSYTSTYNNNWWHYPGSYEGMSKLLIDASIQHDAIFIGGQSSSDTTQLTSEYYSKYRCIILPKVDCMNAFQESQLIQYMNNGGIIIASGETCTKNENGVPVVRPIWRSLTIEGTHKFGNGFFVYFPDDIGISYTYGEKLQFKQIIADEINKHIKAEVIINSPIAPSIFLYEKKNNNTKTLHLVNYDYNPNTDSFSTKYNFPVKVPVDTTRLWEAVYSSPDFPDQQMLSTTIDNGYIQFIVPHLEAYGIVTIQENLSIPKLDFFSPNSDTTIVAGSSLKFLLDVSDGDKNALYYHWYINGKLDSSNTGNTFIYQTTINSSGSDTIFVTITDGSNKLEKRWIVHILEYSFPKILFDESHLEKNTIFYERALQIDPVHPEWVYWGILKSKLAPTYCLYRYYGASINDSVLDSTKVLVIAAAGKQFTSYEAESIKRFVANGGGLFFIGDAGANENWYLLNVFGIAFYGGPLYSMSTQGNFKIINFIEHPSLGLDPKYETNWGGSFTLNSNSTATILAYTDRYVWRNNNWNDVKEDNEPLGPFAFMCASELGNGRAIFIADNAFHDDFIKWESCPNDELFLNIMKWLTEKVNSITTVGDKNYKFPNSHRLYQNYPNPFNQMTTIQYVVPKASRVTIQIFNVRGTEIKTIVNENVMPGTHNTIWDGHDSSGKDMPTGLYFFKMHTNDYSIVKKGLLIR